MGQETQIITYDLTDVLIALLTGILTGYFSYKLLIHKEKSTYIKEKYENVIFPIFELIEPYLYSKEITLEINSVVQKICNCVTENRKFISGYLLENIDFCKKELRSSNTISKKTFISLCSTISIEYDKSCRKLGIPKRTFAYRFNNSQIHPDKRSILNSFVNAIAYICAFMSICVFAYLIFQFITVILKLIGI